MISRLPAIAPRVANPIAVPIATIMSANRAAARMTTASAIVPSSRRPNPMVVEIGLRNGRGERLTQRVEVFGSPGREA